MYEVRRRSKQAWHPSPEVATAFRQLYIVSSAAAQLGGYALEVPEQQWRALVECTERAKTILQHEPVDETDLGAALWRLLHTCEYVVELYVAGRVCPPAAWREAGTLGREADSYLDETASRHREANS
ncbi:hypothetical protein [Paraburkholderia sp. SIMBA_054]|uniref:hypothetical protein n=1 Tax=Paraburkholderia sp. SIMBA_054 TaxID=3085795 RepID=UPI003978ED49